MRDLSAIIITPVANGFIVEMPRNESGIQGFDASSISDMMKGIKKGLLEDSEKWKDDMAQAEELLNKIKPIPVDSSTHIFSTFPEVLDFLDNQFPQL